MLTYDDALHSHLDVAVPQLDAAGFKGTFFLDGDITPADMRRWRKIGHAGHELGQPLADSIPARRAMLPDRRNYYTENYDIERMLGEIAAMNNVLFGIDGAGARTYSVPCSQMLRRRHGDYTDALRKSGLVKYVAHGRRSIQIRRRGFREPRPVRRCQASGRSTNPMAQRSSPMPNAYATQKDWAFCNSTARAATTSKSPPRRIGNCWTGCASIRTSGSRHFRKSWIT